MQRYYSITMFRPDQTSLSVSALTSVLLHVVQRRRTVREDKSQERTDNRSVDQQQAGGDASRSDSQLSVSGKLDAAPVTTTTQTGGKCAFHEIVIHLKMYVCSTLQCG